MGDQRADAHDGVVDVLWKLVAQNLTNICVSLGDKVVSGREAEEIRYGLQVPNDDARLHGASLATQMKKGML
jgi:hypothetical protein